MQDYVTKQMLIDLGINVNDEEAESLLSHLNEKIEEMIGTEIVESLSDEQLTELVKLQEAAKEEEIGEWIADHVPDFQQIVQDNIDIAIGEMADSVDGINVAIKKS